jgi:hypothetical protein
MHAIRSFSHRTDEPNSGYAHIWPFSGNAVYVPLQKTYISFWLMLVVPLYLVDASIKG